MKCRSGSRLTLRRCGKQRSLRASGEDIVSRRCTELARALEREGIRDARVLAAIGRVARELFVDTSCSSDPYGNYPLPIGCGQTISQPYIVALMSELLRTRASDRILEIGTGSGYQAAVLAAMGCEVFTVEILPTLATGAAAALARAGIQRVHQRVGDGRDGWPERAPYDGIIVTAAARQVPASLIEQLGRNGRLVAPIGAPDETQTLVTLEKDATGKVERRAVAPVRFVPLVRG